MPTTDKSPLVTPILIAGCVVLMLSFAIRASFGMFQIPIATEFGWPRAEFSLAIAIQNLAWGIGQPLFGAFAERMGDRRAILLGAVFYAAGLIGSSFAVTPGAHQLLAVIVGFGIAGTGFGVILAIVGRATSAENRSMALGIATAAGSAGQVIGAPVAEFLLQSYSWQEVFLIFAVVILSSLFALPFIDYLFAASSDYTRSLAAIVGVEVGAGAQVPGFLLVLAAFASGLGSLRWPRLRWQRLCQSAH